MKFLPSSSQSSHTDWNLLTNTSSEQRTNQHRDIYAKPQKNSQQQKTRPTQPSTQSIRPTTIQPAPIRLNQPQTQPLRPVQPAKLIQPTEFQPAKPIQPARPAPVAASSVRVVAPSRYPPSSQQNSFNPQDANFSKNNSTLPSAMNQNLTAESEQHRYEEINDESLGGLQIGSYPATVSRVQSNNVIDEFDPYSTVQPPVPELYDNVPDNFNSVYSEHRYEDIPDDVNYDQVPSEIQPQTIAEVGEKCFLILQKSMMVDSRFLGNGVFTRGSWTMS